MIRSPMLAASTLIGACALIASCATAGPDDEATPSAHPHGWVEGATELAEPAVSLAVLDSSGSLTLLGLADLHSAAASTLDPAGPFATDSRFIAGSDADGRLHLIDSGVWTVDHGDHQHHYQASIRDLGELPDTLGIGPIGVDTSLSLSSSESATALRIATTAYLFDREDLGHGRVTLLDASPVDDGSWAAPLADGWARIHEGKLRITAHDGSAIDSAPDGECTNPTGGITTRAGAVFTCDGGVLVVHADAYTKQWTAQRIDMPDGTDPTARPTALHGRPGRPQVAGLDPTGGAWYLNIAESTWTHLDSDGPLQAVAALGDSKGRVVGVDANGRILVWETASNSSPVTISEPIASTSLRPDDLHVTRDRAYVSAADRDNILEIAPADDARTARIIPHPSIAHVLEVGL